MTAVPTLPFVVLKAHRPCPYSDSISTTATSQVPSAALVDRSSPSFSLELRAPPRSLSSEAAPLLAAASAGMGAGATASSSPILPSFLGTGSTSHIPSSPNPVNTSGSLVTSSPGPSIPSTIQTRTLHPRVHYIFENDPLEHDILESIPKSRCITLDLDPRSGSIKNVDSFLTDLQVMDVKLVSSQAALTTSLSSSSLNPLATNTTTNNNNNVSNSVLQQENEDYNAYSSNHTTAMGKAISSGASSLQSSITISTTRSIKIAKSEDKVSTPTSGAGAKDWTLVIEAVEVDERDQESDSELLEQSMISSLDTDMMPENYLPHCDALLRSFTARNLLTQKVIDFTAANSSTIGSPQ